MLEDTNKEILRMVPAFNSLCDILFFKLCGEHMGTNFVDL